MIDWMGLASTLAAFFIVAASPGPATLAVSAISAGAGRRSGLIFGSGLAVGLAFWGGVAATGFGAVLQASPRVLITLKVAGGLYLLWVAWGSARSAMRVHNNKPGPDNQMGSRRKRLFARGLVLNLSNPKAVVAWMAALSVGLGADGSAVHVVVATFGCALIGLLIYAAYAVAFSVSAVMHGYQRFRHWADGMVSALFALAGILLLRSAFTRS